MSALITIPRPGMTDYRPRLAPTAEYWTEPDGTAGVTVLRTDDLELAREMADVLMSLHFVRDTRPISAGEAVWLRRDRGRNWGRVESSKKGAVPAVVFRVIS